MYHYFMYENIYVNMYVCVFIYIYIYMCVYEYTHTLKTLELHLGFKSCRPCGVGRGQLLTRPLELGGQ